jgi:THO complex subunit 2
MYDLEVPTSSYESQLDKFKVQIQQIEDNKDLAPNKRKKEKERHLKVYDNLSNECISQQEHIKRVHKRLQNEKDQWFQSS